VNFCARGKARRKLKTARYFTLIWFLHINLIPSDRVACKYFSTPAHSARIHNCPEVNVFSPQLKRKSSSKFGHLNLCSCVNSAPSSKTWISWRRAQTLNDNVAKPIPDADPFMIYLSAALAEKERALISQRAKAALSAAKSPNLNAAREPGAAAPKTNADRAAANVLPK
jgi:hypothetical protein